MTDKTSILSGYLYKQGDRGPVKGWKKRYFNISKETPTLIRYQRKPNDQDILGNINLELVTGVKQNERGFSGGQYSFQIETPGRIYFLAAPDQTSVNYWMNGIKDILTHIKPQDQEGKNKSERVLDPNVPKSGQLLVNIQEAQKLNVGKDKGHVGVYCIIAMEKQHVRTQVVEDFKNIRWSESFFFDVTGMEVANKKIPLTIGVWVKDISQAAGNLIGQFTIQVSALYDQKPLEQFFKLRKPGISEEEDKSYGELKVKLLFTEVDKRVGKADFSINKVLGRGNFGKVMQVVKKDTGRIYAMKVLRKETIIAADAVQHTLSETNVLRRINHPFIVGLKYSFQSPDKLYMVMDYLSGGELFHHLSNVDRFSEDRARFYAAEIVEALGYLHDQGVVYRDLKPENLLLDASGHICLTDFGLVKENINYGDVTTTFCGSPEYLAPEILQGKPYSKEVDWWALGTFLYEMLEGLPPFYDEDLFEMNKKILHAPLYFDPENFSQDAKSLIRGLLNRDPKGRLGSGKNDYMDIKEHPFFKSIDWSKLYNRELEPEFKPHLRDAEDVRYFDPEFTTQTPQDSFVDSKIAPSKQDLFNGFSYVSTAGFEQAKQRRNKLKQQAANNA